MAAAESINVEVYTGPASDTDSIWSRLRKILNPGEHTVMENALAGIVFLLFIIVIALAATHGGAGGVAPADRVCQNETCLYRAAYLVGLMNRSTDPCDNFYAYACGMSPAVYPIDPTIRERTIVGEVARGNADKLEAILRSPIVRDSPDSYERKLKVFFAKCVDDFLIERVRGSAMAALLGPDFYVLNASASASFDLNQMLLRVGKTFGAPALFQYAVGPNQLDGNRHTISISSGGIGMQYPMYLFDFFKEQREAYQMYMRTVAQLLASDANPASVQPGADARIEDFVADVMEIETQLANITGTATRPDSTKPPLNPANQVSLLDMDRVYQPVKWTSFFIQILEPNAQESTKVALLQPDYLRQVMTYVGETLVILNPTNYNRKLSNYLNWQVIRAYTGDLSSAYVHAKREFESKLSSSSYVFQSRFDYCFNRAKRFMLLGLNSLFVADHLVDESKKAVDNVYLAVKGELIKGVNRLGWIAADEKQKTTSKAQAIVEKLGYSLVETENNYLDEFYRNFRVNSTDYLITMSVNWQEFSRKSLGSQLGTQAKKEDWSGATFDTVVTMTSAAALTVPAGVLQWPLFTQRLPGYINYATIGQRIAAELIKSIDATGQMTDQNGNTNPIWSAQTLLTYVEKAKCVNTSFSGLRAGPYVVGNKEYYVDVDPIIVRNLRQVIAEIDGLRLASGVYASDTAASNTELPLPMGHLDKVQTFYVSWAQTFCYTRDPLYAYIRGQLLRTMPEEILVNGIVSLLPEFGQSFKCPSGSRMVKQPACESIFYK